ncbi:MAG: hypothetical protein JWO25_36 [Alphaproteobacteria bacterium]|nr:hypothetical protein [Alphaproteobacteria bacterium]
MSKKVQAEAPVETPATIWTEPMYLRQVDTRISGLKMNHPGSPEIDRMNAARDDILTRMTDAERKEYDRASMKVKTREEIKAEAEAERIAMDANRDKPPI